MKKIIDSVVLCIFILNMTGCATIHKPKEAQVKVDSEPQGAEVYLTKRKQFGRDREVRVGRTPTTITLKHKYSAELTFRKDGYEESTYTIETQIDNKWMLRSLACLIIPAFIDLVSKNARSLKETEIKVTLDPVLPKQTDQINTKK